MKIQVQVAFLRDSWENPPWDREELYPVVIIAESAPIYEDDPGWIVLPQVYTIEVEVSR